MIHHKACTYKLGLIHYLNGKRVPIPYGVSPAMRVISPQALLRKWDSIVRFMRDTLCLTTCQREVTLRLLQLWVYYPHVYPTERQISSRPGSSKATFWRAIAKLESMNLITIVNRYVKRKHAQISNLYLLDKLVKAIAQYLADKGERLYERSRKEIAQRAEAIYHYLTAVEVKMLAPP